MASLDLAQLAVIGFSRQNLPGGGGGSISRPPGLDIDKSGFQSRKS